MYAGEHPFAIHPPEVIGVYGRCVQVYPLNRHGVTRYFLDLFNLLGTAVENGEEVVVQKGEFLAAIKVLEGRVSLRCYKVKGIFHTLALQSVVAYKSEHEVVKVAVHVLVFFLLFRIFLDKEGVWLESILFRLHSFGPVFADLCLPARYQGKHA